MDCAKHSRRNSVSSTRLQMATVRWILAIPLLLGTASYTTAASVDLTKIHEHMTDDELFSAFNVEDRASVPNYRVVPVFHEERQVHRGRRSISSRNEEGHYFVVLDSLELYLEPVDHVLLGENTPVYLASGNKSQPHGIQYERVEKVWSSNFSMYQDHAKSAAVAVFKEPGGQINFEGTIGNNLVIKPLPTRFKNLTVQNHHLIYKKEYEINSLSPEDYLKKSYWSKRSWDVDPFFAYWVDKYGLKISKPSRKFEPPEEKNEMKVVYVEILVIVDYSTYLAHNKDLQALCKYMAVFWNAVDLRFRSIKKPEIRLNIAGLIVPIDEDGAQYITKHREGKKYLRSSETLSEIGKYLYGEKRFDKETFDVTVVITNLDLCSVRSNDSQNFCDPSISGRTRFGGVCLHNMNESIDATVAVIEDNAGFGGVLTAAHEIGHLLGSDHDMKNGYQVMWTRCDWRQGFLMAFSTKNSSNSFLWSDCSVEQIQSYIRRKGQCLLNKPVVKKPIMKMLPGQLMSRDEQCRMRHGAVACEIQGKQNYECRRLYCREPNDKCTISTEPPVERTPCSGGGICLDGVCIHVAGNKISG